MDCIIHGVTKSQTKLSDFHFHFGTPKTDFTDGALRELIAADSQEVVEETVSASKRDWSGRRSCKRQVVRPTPQGISTALATPGLDTRKVKVLL